jgi:hypothetical protein
MSSQVGAEQDTTVEFEASEMAERDLGFEVGNYAERLAKAVGSLAAGEVEAS